MNVIEVHQLVKLYRTKRAAHIRAVDGISFTVEQGQIFGILGPNGAGKTTTLKVLTTLLRPTSGSVTIMGHDAVAAALEVRKSIVAVLQENAVEGFLSVRDNFRTFGRFHGQSRNETDRRADYVTELFGLRDYIKEKPIDLSGGLKRRVQVAKVFMVNTPLVFLDEPTTGMDSFNKRTALQAIREASGHGRTIVLTTHVLHEAEELCDDVVIINRGKIIATGSPLEIRSLSLKMYHLTIVVEQVTDELRRFLTEQRPLNTDIRGTDITVTLRTHRDALTILAGLERLTPLHHFELSTATLEDAFLSLLETTGDEAA